MPWYPPAVRKNIPPGDNDPSIKGQQRIAVLHVDAGNADSLFEYFRDRSGGVEAHFFVTKAPDPHRPGCSIVEQYRDTDWQADANLDANDFSLSVETQGFGEGEWTDEQLASIKALLVWMHETHGIPLVECTAWDGRGVGYHVMWGSPSHWTPSVKTCPGPDRIRQYEDVLVPWMRAGAPLEEPMSDAQVQEITTAVRRNADRVIGVVRNQGQIASRQRARALAAIDDLAETGLTRRDVRLAVERALADQEEAT